MDLALNNLQRLICHKTQQTQTLKLYHIHYHQVVLIAWSSLTPFLPVPIIHRGVMVKAMDCGIVVREFVRQSRYYVHFRAYNIGKGMSPLILPAILGEWLWH